MRPSAKPSSASSGCNVSNAANRFDFLRLLFAGAVALYHAFVLAQLAPRHLTEKYLGTAAELSIQGFFIISGALVLGSLVRSDKVGLYAEKRFRRLFPAYAVVILVPAIIAQIISGELKAVLAYVLPNLVFLNFIEPTLPGSTANGLFQSYAGIVNGALWTLKIEVMFYLALPIIWSVMKRSKKLHTPVIVALIIGAEAWRYYFGHVYGGAFSDQLARQLPGQMGYFAIGMALWLSWQHPHSQDLKWLLLGTIMVALSVWLPELHIMRPLGLGLIIQWAAFAVGPTLNAARYGDMSYGLYITHFPIIQMCIALGLFATPIIGLVVSLGLTIAASYALWHLIEKRALLPSSHYRQSQPLPRGEVAKSVSELAGEGK